MSRMKSLSCNVRHLCSSLMLFITSDPTHRSCHVAHHSSSTGTTPLGSSLDRKVLQPMVLAQARNNSMQKPVLVICITDGEPTGEPKDTVRQVVMSAKQHLQNSPYGPGAVAFQFAQAGFPLLHSAHRLCWQWKSNAIFGQAVEDKAICTSGEFSQRHSHLFKCRLGLPDESSNLTGWQRRSGHSILVSPRHRPCDWQHDRLHQLL